MRKHERISPDEVRRLLAYDPETGVLTWTDRHSIRIPYAGAVAGTIDAMGYVLVSIKYRRVRGHTLAWVIQTGRYPDHEIDHINGTRSDNRWVNLREADHCTNMQNLQRARKDNRTGLLGATSHCGGKYYTAEIRVNSNRYYLGSFPTAEQAHAAYVDAKAKIHK